VIRLYFGKGVGVIKSIFVITLSGLLALAANNVQAQTDLLPRANQLIRQGQPKQAIELLGSVPEVAKADATYHYILGTAYLDTGEADKSILEFQEALRIKPDLLQAQAELGRAYLLTGNYIAANQSFDRVRAANPPPEVLASMASYVERVHGVAQAQRQRFRGSVSFGMGHDSNVNSATSAQQVTLPIFGGIVATLSPDAQARSDSFHNVGVEASGFMPISSQTELFASGGAQVKNNSTITAYNFLSANLNGGVRYTYGAQQQSQVALSTTIDTVHQDSAHVRDSYGLNLEYRRIVHPLAEVSGFVQVSNLDYLTDDFRDARREIYGVAVNPVAFGKRLFNLPPVASIYWGSERPVAAGVDHLGYSVRGVRTAALKQFNPRLTLIGGLSYERRNYGAVDPTFAVTRQDTQTDLVASLLYSLNRQWLLSTTLSFTQNRSSLAVFDYERNAFAVVARYSF